jgi:outer membrane protein OmpA-like peptidoglycan-associated protein
MKIIYLYKISVLFLLLISSFKNSAQQPPQTNKKESPKTSVKNNPTPTKLNINKAQIDKTYSQLSVAEKEKVKELPAIPEAFRNNIEAQDFLFKLKDFDIYKILSQNAGRSLVLTSYYVGYNGVKQKAEYIVKEAEKLKAAFLKNNPSVNFGANIGKTYTSENSLVYLPLGDASFADEVVSANYIAGNVKFPVENCLNIPNYLVAKNVKESKGIYSLGIKGRLIIRFTNNALVDVVGPDLFVFETGEIEPTNLEISKDGISWIPVGTISGGTASVDINKFAQPNEYYYYVRLTDLDTKSGIPGADIDAIATIGAAMRLSLAAEVLFDLGKAELKVEGIAAIKKLAQQLQTMSNAQLNVDGYTDDIGTDETNIKLSLLRAQAVSAILKAELKNKINFIYKETGKGKANPAVPNTNEENRKMNRRVEILVIPK